jgi:hypothetical protein
MERFTGLHVPIDLNIDGMMQEGEAAVFLINVSSGVEKFLEPQKILKFDGLMSCRYVRHRLVIYH